MSGKARVLLVMVLVLCVCVLKRNTGPDHRQDTTANGRWRVLYLHLYSGARGAQGRWVMVMVMVLNSAYTGPLPRYL